MALKVISDAPSVWALLNGIVCVYKPAGHSCYRVRNSFLGKISRELNELDPRPAKTYTKPVEDESGLVSIQEYDNFAENPLVMGPKYEEKDFKCTWSTYLGTDTAGVLVLGLNRGSKKVYAIHQHHPLRVYHLQGSFGFMTDNLYKNGKVLDKHAFKHIRQSTLESLLSAVQASHQRTMYELCGVDPQSQEAYELASKGLIRPENSTLPVIYGVKCVDFNLPDFTIEVHCVNEYEAYLKALIHSIGMKLRSLATCTGLQCIRHSYFSLEDSLLMKHWTLQYVIENIANNERIIRKHGKLESGLLKGIQT